MYKNFFGFKERPFKLVPNPAYLFLGRSHEEVMAHLVYAISQGDGFVEITGEVGTGKTTLCRAFLENLHESTEAAYIFNPKLDSLQLLKAINDEFGISAEADNTKDLIDCLNLFLMEKKAAGKKVILLVDEAQNLKKEALEQLRLLSNLETTVDKLLQIILVGQPELGEMLDSHELRQLGQRITLSCHLVPLTYKETREYIQHRIRIASKKPGVKFHRSAFRSIYKYARGIPRLINIVCDRALLTAYGLNRQRITGNIARASIRELAYRGEIKRSGLQEGKRGILVFALLCVVLFVVTLYPPVVVDRDDVLRTSGTKTFVISKPEQSGVKADIKPTVDQTVIKRQEEEMRFEQEPVAITVTDLGDFLAEMNPSSSRRMAFKGAMALWNMGSEVKPYLDSLNDDQTFFRFAAKQKGLSVLRIEDDLSLVKKLDLPAIIEFYVPRGLSPAYLTLTKMDDNGITLTGGGERDPIVVELHEMMSYWSGVAYIPWKDFLAYAGDITLNSPTDSIITLKMHMRDIGFDEVEMSPFYDEITERAVREIQEKHGIPVDGIVGPLTKIVLYNEKKSLKSPHIKNESEIFEPTQH